jgi:transcriptional regulator with XRE-family HTH domain
MKQDYQKICQDLIKDLPQRQKDIIEQRFGLKNGERKTLQEIGDNYGITRERVRQIEEDGFSKIRPKLEKYQEVFQYFGCEIEKFGGLRKEDILLNSLAGQKFQNQVFFLLTLGEKFQRFAENKIFHSLWAIDQNSFNFAKEVLDFLSKKLLEIGRPLGFTNLLKEANSQFKSLTSQILQSYLEVSKRIQLGIEGNYGLKDWPEINPRGVRDRAYLIFKKEKRPLHFAQVTQLINNSKFEKISQPPALLQTVHNELIKDERFVLVGRGLYALREWGYQPGVVKDVISMILQEEKKPLTREEIIDRVLKQRMVKVNTILLNLSHFPKTSDGKYRFPGGRKPVLG